MSRILVIEDEPRIASLVAKALRADQHEVLVAEDGSLGLFLATTDEADVVVLDLGLPTADGPAVLSALRARTVAPPVVVLTGRDAPEWRTACLDAGAAAFLTKPFSFSALRAEVRRQLSSTRVGVR